MSGVKAWTQDLLVGLTKSINSLNASVQFWTGMGFGGDIVPRGYKTKVPFDEPHAPVGKAQGTSQQLNIVAAITTQFLLKTAIEQTYFQQSGLSMVPVAYLAHDIVTLLDPFEMSSLAYTKQFQSVISTALSVFSIASLGFSFFASASGLWDLDQLEHAPMLMAYFAAIVCAPVYINKLVDHFFGDSVQYQFAKPWIKAFSKSLVSFIPKVSTSASGVHYQFPHKQGWTTIFKPFQKLENEPLLFRHFSNHSTGDTMVDPKILKPTRKRLLASSNFRTLNVTVGETSVHELIYVDDIPCGTISPENIGVACPTDELTFIELISQEAPFASFVSVTSASFRIRVTANPVVTNRFWYEGLLRANAYQCPLDEWTGTFVECTRDSSQDAIISFEYYVPDRNPLLIGNTTDIKGNDGLFQGRPFSGTVFDPDGDEVTHSAKLAISGSETPAFWNTDGRTGINNGAYTYKHAGVWSAIETGTSALDGTLGETYGRQIITVDSKIHLPFTLSLPPGQISVSRELDPSFRTFSQEDFSLPTGILFATSDSSPITNIEFVTDSPAITYSRSRGVLEFDTTQDYRFYQNTSIPMVHTGYFLGTAESGETCKLFPLDCVPYPPSTAITSNVSISQLNSPPFFTRGFSPFIANVRGTAGFVIPSNARSDADAVDIAGLTCSFEMQDGGPLLPGMVPSSCSIFWDIPAGTEIKTHNVNVRLHDLHGGISNPEVLSFIVQATGVTNVPGLPDEIAASTVHEAGSTSIPFPLQNLDLDPATMVAELEPSVAITPSHPSIATTWNALTQEYDIRWNFPDSLTDSTQRVLFSIGQVSYRADILVTNPGPTLVDLSAALEATTGLVGTDFALDILSKFTHIDGAAVLSISGTFPNGLSIGADGVVRGTIAQRTGRSAPYVIDLTVCDAFGDIGRCMLPAPKLSLSIPRSVPEASNYPATSVPINPLKVEGDPEFTGTITASDPDGYDDLECNAPSNIPILRMNSDCTFGVDVRHGLQREYGNIPVTVKNDDGLTTIVNLPLNVPRGTWGFLSTMPNRFSFNLGQPGSIRMCQTIFDGGVASGCGHLQATWNLPAGLQGATADGTSLDIFAALGSQAQGNYTVNLTLSDRLPTPGIRTKQIVVSYNSHAPEISSSAVLAFAGQEDGPDVIVPYPGVDDLDGDPFDVPPIITGIPTRCERQDDSRRLVCSGLGPGVYDIQFSYTDPQGLGVSTTVGITISPLPEGPNFWQQHWPKLVGAFFSAIPVAAGITAIYYWTHKKTAALHRTYQILPRLINKAKSDTPTPVTLDLEAPAVNLQTISIFASNMPTQLTRANEDQAALNTLKENFITHCQSIKAYLKSNPSATITSTYILTTTQIISKKLNEIVTAEAQHKIYRTSLCCYKRTSVTINDDVITPRLTTLVEMLFVSSNLLIEHFANKPTGIKLDLKRSLLGGIVETVKILRKYVLHTQSHSFGVRIEALSVFEKALMARAAIAALRDDDIEGCAKCIPCIGKTGEGSANVKAKAQIAKKWYPFAKFIIDAEMNLPFRASVAQNVSRLVIACNTKRSCCQRTQQAEDIIDDIELNKSGFAATKNAGPVNYWASHCVANALATWSTQERVSTQALLTLLKLSHQLMTTLPLSHKDIKGDIIRSITNVRLNNALLSVSTKLRAMPQSTLHDQLKSALYNALKAGKPSHSQPGVIETELISLRPRHAYPMIFNPLNVRDQQRASQVLQACGGTPL